MKINHELCSELLGPFLRGELDEVRRQEVEAHLTSCPECSEELRALQILEEAEPGPATLSELEIARLHRDVWAAVGAVPGQERRSLGARLVPFLGTAAVLALFAVGAVTLGGGGADQRAGEDASAEMEYLDATEDQDVEASQEEAGDAAGGTDGAGSTRTTAENSPLVDESAELQTRAAPEDETMAEGAADSLSFDGGTAKQSFLLGCSVGVGAGSS